MKDYKSYLFDLDGTLIDTIELIIACFEQSLKKLDVIKSREEIRANIGLNLEEQFRSLLKDYPHKVDYAALMEHHMDYQLKIWRDYIKVQEGVISTLRSLKDKGKNLAIVTSRRLESTQLYLKAFHLSVFFDCIITPESTTKHKPYPEPALKALSLLRTDSQEALFIGDSNFDMLCATRANIDTYFVSWGVGTLDDLSTKPTYIHSDISLLNG